MTSPGKSRAAYWTKVLWRPGPNTCYSFAAEFEARPLRREKPTS